MIKGELSAGSATGKLDNPVTSPPDRSAGPYPVPLPAMAEAIVRPRRLVGAGGPRLVDERKPQATRARLADAHRMGQRSIHHHNLRLHEAPTGEIGTRTH